MSGDVGNLLERLDAETRKIFGGLQQGNDQIEQNALPVMSHCPTLQDKSKSVPVNSR